MDNKKNTIAVIVINVCVFAILWFSVEYICGVLNKRIELSRCLVKDDLFNLLDSGNCEYDADLFFKLKPNICSIWGNNTQFVTNSEGWRTESTQKNSKEIERDTKKIIVTGDSSTFGLGLTFENTYGAVLEKMIDESTPQSVKVFNYGVPGFTSFQCKKLLEEKIPSLKPYLVICYIGANDGAPVMEYSDREYWRFINSINKSFAYRVLKHSNVYKLLRAWKLKRKMSIIKEAISHLPQDKDWFSIALPDVLLELEHKGVKLSSNIFRKKRVSPEEFQENLQAMRDLAQKYNALFIYIPNVWNTKEGFTYNEDYLTDTYLNIIEEFKKYEVDDVLLDTVHPSKKGHYIIAKMIFNSLK